VNKRIAYVVDDDLDVCETLADLLECQGVKAICFTSSNQFLSEIEPPRVPTIAILDLMMPEKNGLEVQEVLREKNIICPLIFLTGSADVNAAINGMRSGAVDYLLKPVDPEKLISTIERAFEISERDIQMLERRKTLDDLFARLTPRELEICFYIAKGHTAKMIGRELGISPRTAEIHRSRIMEKLSVASSADLVSMSIAYGIRD
jgi:two-component system, LuxR family, response regulator FixJ